MKDDLISRQAALDAMDTWDKFRCDPDGKLVRCDDDKHYIPYVHYEDMVHAVKNLPPAQPELTDDQAIMHLQSSGWMQRHDKEMYESGIKEQLADDSDSYDSLLPSAQPELRRKDGWRNGRKEEMKMDDRALEIVRNYITEHLDKSDPMPNFTVFTVWKCKTLQNWKYLLSSTLFDGMYYELTYNGDKNEWYLDAYKKFQNVVVK